MPYRAPIIIVISTQYQEHAKVPKIEQTIAAGCCAHSMQMAASQLPFWSVNKIQTGSRLAFGSVNNIHRGTPSNTRNKTYLFT